MTSHTNRAPLRLRRKVKHVLTAMLCCGKRKDEEGGGGGGGGVSMAPARGIVVQRDFRKVSGISNEVFRQLEAVEREAAPHEGGEMLLRLFDPCALGRVGAESYRQYLGAADAQHLVRFVEIVKRPGQTLGLYIREGDGLRETEGVFISRIALESAVYNSGLLRVGDEILAVNLVDVRRMSLDDVVIVMSIPRRLVLTIRSRVCSGGQRVRQLTAAHERRQRPPPVVVLKQDTTEEGSNGENGENGHLIRARTKGLPPEIPAIAVKLSERDHQRERHRYETPPTDEFRFQPQHHRPSTLPHHHHPYHQAPPRWAHHRRTRSAVLSPRHSATTAPPTQAAEGILRRGGGGGSVSDTEADSSSLWTHHHQMGGGRRQRYGGRSHSLPRGYGGGRHGVRFTTSKNLPYGDSSQEESDGAVSAPELPARANSMRRRPASVAPPRRVFTSNEYRAWMRRAPSTSAIYDRLRPPHPLPRVAYSAESLLDTVRQDGGGIYTFPRRLQTPGSLPHPAEEEDRLLRLVSLDPRDFNKYHRSVSGGAGGGGGESGLLWVHLLSGRGLMGGRGGGGGFRDLYCVLECDRVHKARTVIRTGDHSFDWDEIFEIDLVDNREVAFLLYSWDPRFRHKLCYKGTLHLGALLRESPVHSLALKLEPRGTLYLKLRHKDPLHAFQRTPAPAHQALFGADLEAVLVREDSGFGVPLIVKRCTEEVERRGLEIVGIYRLCGSALRKRLLRDEFERSASHANLSVEHVPDINVVTSVLKDYLRELPEPLLSRSLYDMLVDGLSVCLPEDPQGSANLIFSILECLPKANLCTVLLLLDHLRLIASHCDRNRMGCEGLAAAFGPALACAAPHHIDIAQPIDITARLLRMWPDKRSPRLWFDAACNQVYRM